MIEPNETKEIEIEFKTNIDFPNKIEITRFDKKEKTEKYILNIEK